MELSESVTKGLQALADPSLFDLKSFTIFTEVSFDSLVSSAGETVLGKMALFFFVLQYFRCSALMKEVGQATLRLLLQYFIIIGSKASILEILCGFNRHPCFVSRLLCQHNSAYI